MSLSKNFSEMISRAFGGWKSIRNTADEITTAEAELPIVRRSASNLVNTLSLHRMTSTMATAVDFSANFAALLDAIQEGSILVADLRADPIGLNESQVADLNEPEAPGSRPKYVRYLSQDEAIGFLSSIEDSLGVTCYDHSTLKALTSTKDVSLYQCEGEAIPMTFSSSRDTDTAGNVQDRWTFMQVIEPGGHDASHTRLWSIIRKIGEDATVLWKVIFFTYYSGQAIDDPSVIAAVSDVTPEGSPTVSYIQLDDYIDACAEPSRLYECFTTLIEASSRTGTIEAAQALTIVDSYGPSESISSLKAQLGSIGKLSNPSMIAVVGSFFQGKLGKRSSDSSVAFTAHSTPGYTRSIIGSLVSIAVAAVAAILTIIFHSFGAVIAVALYIISTLLQYFRDNFKLTQGKVSRDSEIPAWNYPLNTYELVEYDADLIDQLLTFGAIAYDNVHFPFVVWYIVSGEIRSDGGLPCTVQILLRPMRADHSGDSVTPDTIPYSAQIANFFHWGQIEGHDEETGSAWYRLTLSMTEDAEFFVDAVLRNEQGFPSIAGHYSWLSTDKSYLSYADNVLENAASVNFYATAVISAFLYWMGHLPNLETVSGATNTYKISSQVRVLCPPSGYSLTFDDVRDAVDNSIESDNDLLKSAIAILVYDQLRLNPNNYATNRYTSVVTPVMSYDWVTSILTSTASGWTHFSEDFDTIQSYVINWLCFHNSVNSSILGTIDGKTQCGLFICAGYPLADLNCEWPSTSRGSLLSAVILAAVAAVATVATVCVVRAARRTRATARLAMAENRFETAKEELTQNPTSKTAQKRFKKANRKLTKAWKRAGRAGVTMYNGFDTGSDTAISHFSDSAAGAISSGFDSDDPVITYVENVQNQNEQLSTIVSAGLDGNEDLLQRIQVLISGDHSNSFAL